MVNKYCSDQRFLGNQPREYSPVRHLRMFTQTSEANDRPRYVCIDLSSEEWVSRLEDENVEADKTKNGQRRDSMEQGKWIELQGQQL